LDPTSGPKTFLDFLASIAASKAPVGFADESSETGKERPTASLDPPVRMTEGNQYHF
jgi:hypothetical protein